MSRLTFQHALVAGEGTVSNPFPLRLTHALSEPLQPGRYEVSVEQFQFRHFSHASYPLSFTTRCFLSIVAAPPSVSVSGVGQELRASTSYTVDAADTAIPQPHWLHIPLTPDHQNDHVRVSSAIEGAIGTPMDAVGLVYNIACFWKSCGTVPGNHILISAPTSSLSIDLLCTTMGSPSTDPLVVFSSETDVTFMASTLSKTQLPSTDDVAGIHYPQSIQLAGTLLLTPVRSAH